jgi:hypothetical protein
MPHFCLDGGREQVMAKQPYIGVAIAGIAENPVQEWDGNLFIQTRCFSRT